MRDHAIAFDVGTSSVKAALVHRTDGVIASATQSYPLHQPRPGWVEQDPEDYWQAVVQATRRVLTESDVSRDSVFGLAFAAQAMGVIPMGGDGRVLHRNITWVDGRAERQAKQIMRLFGGEAIFKRLVGIELTGKDVLPKLAWLREQEPRIYEQTDKVLDVNGYLKFRATGRMVFEWSGACSYSFNLRKKDWTRLHFRAIGWDMSKLPELVRSTDAVGTLTARSAEQLGLPRDTQVFGGCDDPQSAAIGSGSVGEGEAHINLGSSAWVVATTRRTPRFKHGAVCLQSADPDRHLVIGITESAGSNLEWFIDRFYSREKAELETEDLYQLLEREAAAAPPGSDRLIFTPWLLGERCPVSTTTTRGTVFNLGPEHTRGHLVRALAEGVGYNLRWIIENYRRDFGLRSPRLRVIGGGSRNEHWLQMISDLTQRELETTNHPETAGAIGAAMCAFVGKGLLASFQDVHRIVRPARTYHPNAKLAAIYDPCFRDYKRVYHDLRRAYRTANTRRFAEAP